MARVRQLAPLVLTVALWLLPAPEGLAPHAWRYFAIFAGVVLALMLEPLPGGAVGLIGVVVVAVLSPWVLFGPADLARPGFRADNAALQWALSGFANGTVWLIFAAFMFAAGYEKTGLGRRLALMLVRRMGGRTLGLGYAIALADLALAPFTPSNTARSGGTIFPVIRQLPALFESRPYDASSRRIGGYLMWVALAATCVTSSMFATALATNVLAVELVRKTVEVSLGWTEWFLAFLPVGLLLLAAVPLLAWWWYPPEVRSAPEVPTWADAELRRLGPPTPREWGLVGLVVGALGLWILGSDLLNPTLTALLVVGLMLLSGILSWDDVTGHRAAWGTFAWFATLVALADGLGRTGFVAWAAQAGAAMMTGWSPFLASHGLIIGFFLAHYLFASTTAHATALLPVVLAVGSAIPDLDVKRFALQLCLTLGLMGIISPYATGPSPIYFGAGYIPARDFWRLGAAFGAVYLLVFLVSGVPWGN